MRLAIISYCPPLPSWGGAMTFHRHFVERNDFEIICVCPPQASSGHPVSYNLIPTATPRVWQRLTHTRLLPWLSVIDSLWGEHLVCGKDEILNRLREFRPEAVFTVAGSWASTALLARWFARRLGIPLIASFNDWYDYGWMPVHPALRPLVERRFRRFYREADLALCTCEGMREALGDHPNAHVWYPTGAPMSSESEGYEPAAATDVKPMVVFFGGSLGDWYGPMMESLVEACECANVNVRFQIFGTMQAWSGEFDRRATAEGIFGGSLPFDELRARAAEADLLILPMGFGKECAHVERTSFKTKFLDYLSFRRPILVWGPEYCSAVRVAREFDSAECVIDPSPEACARAIRNLAGNPGRRGELIKNARKMYEDRFHPDKIHGDLVRKICEVAARGYPTAGTVP